MSREQAPFCSPLRNVLVKFLEEKRACGYRYQREEHLLRALDRFLVARRLRRRELPRALVEEWTAARAQERPRTQRMRLTVARQLATFLARQGCSAYIPPLNPRRGTGGEFTARIFSRHEIAKILQAADDLPPCRWSPLHHLVIPELFRVLYGCGLRRGEALRLTVEDVDLNDGVLRIREGKFRKDRFVPMAPGLTERLRRYAEALGARETGQPFFPSPRGGAYSSGGVYRIFRRLLRAAGVPHHGRGRGPRLHEIRHSFAVHRLERWYAEGVDLNAKLPLLSSYMGHRCMHGTQVYLQLTESLFSDVSIRLEAVFGHVIPTGSTES